MVEYPVYKPDLNGREKEYVTRCMDSGWISSKGEFIDKFEKSFLDYTGGNYALSVGNGTVAIHLALVALGIKPGDEVIVPSFTYIASINPIIQIGAKPVFVDSDPQTWQISIDDIRAKITRKTRAIMAVHLYGHPCDMDGLTAICNQHNLLLVEDCAEAFGAFYKGKHVGTFGDIATFSFFGNKTITTGEGGMVIAKNKDVADLAASLKTQGVSKTKQYWHDHVAFNYRMTNIQAAIGLAQIERIEDILQRKRRIAERYIGNMAGTSVRFQPTLPDCIHSYWMCAATVSNEAERDALRFFLLEQGVETRPTFYPAHLMPIYAPYNTGTYPIAMAIGPCGINLPSYPELTDADVDKICERIRDYYRLHCAQAA